MIYIKDKIDITAEQARFILEKETSRFGVCIDLDRVLDYQADLIERFKPMLKPFRELAGSTTLMPTERNDIIRILQQRFKLPQHKLLVKNKLALTTAVVKQLLADPTLDEVTKEFLKIYRQLKVCSYNISYLDQYADLPLLGQESFEGHRMVLARPEWTVLSTSRISAKSPSIQNIAAHFADIVTYPKGYILVRADSGQIEPRITYSKYIPDPLLKQLIINYNDAYYGMLDFALMDEEEERMYRQDLSKLVTKPMTEERVKLRKELKLLLLVGNYGGDLDRGFDPMLTIGFRNKIQNHPMRKLWEEEVTEQVRNGVDTFYAAFGTPITPEETNKYQKGSPAWMGHLVRCGINNPIQGTASELMCQSVYEADRIISQKAKGYTAIGYYKHDEGCFYVDEKDADLVDELAGCMSYQVEGWIPVHNDLLIGKKEAAPVKDMEDLDLDTEFSDELLVMPGM